MDPVRREEKEGEMETSPQERKRGKKEKVSKE